MATGSGGEHVSGDYRVVMYIRIYIMSDRFRSMSSFAWQDRFFPFFFVVAENGSGTLLLAVMCRESPHLGDC